MLGLKLIHIGKGAPELCVPHLKRRCGRLSLDFFVSMSHIKKCWRRYVVMSLLAIYIPLCLVYVNLGPTTQNKIKMLSFKDGNIWTQLDVIIKWKHWFYFVVMHRTLTKQLIFFLHHGLLDLFHLLHINILTRIWVAIFYQVAIFLCWDVYRHLKSLRPGGTYTHYWSLLVQIMVWQQ